MIKVTSLRSARLMPIILVLCLMANLSAYAGPTFVAVPDGMTADRHQHSATLLADGRVLVLGGYGSAGSLSSGELYDPVAGTFAALPYSMTHDRYAHEAVLLEDGRVLVSGGYGTGGHLASSEIYDPVAATFTVAGSMAAHRSSFTATRLLDGRVLVVGGYDGNDALSSAEVFDPTTGTFSPTSGGLAFNRNAHTATLLPDGRVLIVGGVSLAGFRAGGEIFDPSTATFSPTPGDMHSARAWHAATLLEDGRVLVVGGYNGSAFLSATETFDPSTGTFTAAGSLLVERAFHTATRLTTSGAVLISGGARGTGGVSGDDALSIAELYDPLAQGFGQTFTMTEPRYAHTATKLESGKVLLTGGLAVQGPQALSSAEIFDPGSYRLLGLFSPYGPPAQRAFKSGSVIPLAWQFGLDGVVVDSAGFAPTLTAYGPVPCGDTDGATTIAIDVAGAGGLRYDTTTRTWRFNWKTAKGTDGCFYVRIDETTSGVSSSFPIKIMK